MKRATLRLSASLILGCLFFISSCDGSADPLGPTETPPTQDAVQFSLSPSGLTLKIGETATILPTLTTSKGKAVNPRALKWESDVAAVAEVDRDGVVTGVGGGEALVIATSGNLADTTRVRVLSEAAPRIGMAITPDTVVFTWLDATASMTAAVYDASGTPVAAPGLTWKSLNPGIAQVNSMGVVTAKGLGVAAIVAVAACCDQADTAYARVQQVVDSVSMDEDTVSLKKGATQEMTATAWDRGGTIIDDAKFTWTTGNQSVATVSSDGVVTAVASGSTTVRAASGSASATSVVTVDAVTAPPPPPPPPSGGLAELPRAWVNTDWVEPTGKVISVPAGGNLQAAIDGAQRGDVIELQAGATYTGNFTLPAKSGTGWIVIRSSGKLPPPGTRVTPAQKGSLARLVSDRSDRRPLTVSSSASHYRIVGLEVTYASGVTSANSIISIPNGSRHIILDRSYVHGHSSLNLQRCVILHAEHGAVIDSWLSECHYKGADSQAIIVWNTNGPIKIVNNHLEGAGENVMIGGATPSENTLPADIEIRRNHFYKPQSWRLPDGTSRWTVKNLFEVKFGVRMLLEDNIFDGNWKDGQDGHAFNIKLSSRGSGDRAGDITIRNNIVRNSLSGFKFGSSLPRIVIENNVIYNIESRLFTLLSSRDMRILNNTALHGSSIIISDGAKHSGFVARGNIWGSEGGYGVKGGGSEGTSTLNADFSGWVYDNNGHIGRREERYPDGNRFVSNVDAARFTSASTGDVRLRTDSPFAGLGANVAQVLAATNGVK